MDDLIGYTRSLLFLKFPDDAEKFRVASGFEEWESSSMPSNFRQRYYNVHVRHAELPQFGAGVGGCSLKALKIQIREHLIPMIAEALKSSKRAAA